MSETGRGSEKSGVVIRVGDDRDGERTGWEREPGVEE